MSLVEISQTQWVLAIKLENAAPVSSRKSCETRIGSNVPAATTSPITIQNLFLGFPIAR